MNTQLKRMTDNMIEEGYDPTEIIQDHTDNKIIIKKVIRNGAIMLFGGLSYNHKCEIKDDIIEITKGSC